jgi:MoxR-like ATPase
VCGIGAEDRFGIESIGVAAPHFDHVLLALSEFTDPRRKCGSPARAPATASHEEEVPPAVSDIEPSDTRRAPYLQSYQEPLAPLAPPNTFSSPPTRHDSELQARPLGGHSYTSPAGSHRPPPADRQLAGVSAHPDVAGGTARIAANIERVIDGKPEIVRLSLAVLLAEGHLLIEDVPGVGKTKLAKALARSIDCSVRRIQFTPDLLPSDITGVSIYSTDSRDFEFRPGAVFANIVVGDEINRASPKTQSALLECMEERQVTVDGTTYTLESPFLVLATQNPIDMEGTYPLPESQRDRFTARISMGYPDRRAEVTMLAEHAALDPLDSLHPVSDAGEVRALIQAVRAVHVADSIKGYAVDIAEATRTSSDIRLGASPRAVLQLVRASKAWAAIDGRSYVIPDDLQYLADPVLTHRIIVTPEAQIARRGPRQILESILSKVAAPTDLPPRRLDSRSANA